MTIECGNAEEFYNTIAALVKRGLLFNADHYTLTITLTGGF